jgi:hypothetical protein
VLNLDEVERLKLKQLTVKGIKGYEGNNFASGGKTLGLWAEENDGERLQESVVRSL